MGKRDALAKFREADDLYRERKYTDALAVLDALDERYPGQKNVMLPKARCLYHLNQMDEAEKLADGVVRKFGDPKAVKLLERIRASRARGDDAPPPLPEDDGADLVPANLDDIDIGGANLDPLKAEIADGFTSEKLKEQPEVVAAPERNWPMILGIAAGVLVVAAILCLPLVRSNNSASTTTAAVEQSATSSDEMPVWGIRAEDGYLVYRGFTFTWLGWIAFFVFLEWIQYSINLGATLLVLGRLPHDKLSENLIEVIGTSLAGIFLTGTIFGLIRAISLLRDKYDFGIGELALLGGFSLVTTGVFWGSAMYLYWSTMMQFG